MNIVLSLDNPLGNPPKKRKKEYKCPHGIQKYECNDCGGKGVCPHRKRKSRCIDCSGTACCEHGGLRRTCGICGGTGICKHGLNRRYCYPCGGSSLCLHQKNKFKCPICKRMCPHELKTYNCNVCKKNINTEFAPVPPSVPVVPVVPATRRTTSATSVVSGIQNKILLCPHNRTLSRCIDCPGGGKDYCQIHLCIKKSCRDCQANRICKHGTRHGQCDVCSEKLKKPMRLYMRKCMHNEISGNCPLCKQSDIHDLINWISGKDEDSGRKNPERILKKGKLITVNDGVTFRLLRHQKSTLLLDMELSFQITSSYSKLDDDFFQIKDGSIVKSDSKYFMLKTPAVCVRVDSASPAVRSIEDHDLFLSDVFQDAGLIDRDNNSSEFDLDFPGVDGLPDGGDNSSGIDSVLFEGDGPPDGGDNSSGIDSGFDSIFFESACSPCSPCSPLFPNFFNPVDPDKGNSWGNLFNPL